MEEKDKRVIFSDCFNLDELLDDYIYDPAFVHSTEIMARKDPDDWNVYFYSSDDYAYAYPLFMVDEEGSIDIFDSWRPSELHVLINIEVHEYPEIYRYDDEEEIIGIDYRRLIRRIFLEVNYYWQNHYVTANYIDHATDAVIYSKVFSSEPVEELEDE